MTSQNHKRFDNLSQVQRVTSTPQGGIRVEGAVSRIGILEYLNSDGSIRRELRLPEEVFNEDSLKTLDSAPVTLKHPEDMVDTTNYHLLSRGHVAEGKTKQEDQYLVTELVIQDEELKNSVLNKELSSISCGYWCKLEKTPGTWQGLQYDCIQRNIQYNHVALGPEGWGRAGSEVSIRLDSPSTDTVIDDVEKNKNKNKNKKEKEQSASTKNDNKDIVNRERKFSVDKEKELKEKLSQALKRIDQLEEELQMKAEEELEAEQRTELMSYIEKFGVEVAEDASLEAVRMALISKAVPGFEFPEAPSEEEETETEEVVEDEDDTLSENKDEDIEIDVSDLNDTDAEKTDAFPLEMYKSYLKGAADVAIAILVSNDVAEVRGDSRVRKDNGFVKKQSIKEQVEAARKRADEAQRNASFKQYWK